MRLLDGEYFYIACVYSAYLDQHVNSERTQFTVDDVESDEIKRAVLTVAREFLHEYVEKALAAKQHIATELVQENPQFIYAMGDLNSFVERLPANFLSREEIFVELSRTRYRRQRRFESVRQEIREDQS